MKSRKPLTEAQKERAKETFRAWQIKNRKHLAKLARIRRKKNPSTEAQKKYAAEKAREWYKNNKDRKRLADQNYRDKNKESIDKTKKKYRRNHKEKFKLIAKQWRLKNKEKRRQIMKRYSAKHRDKILRTQSESTAKSMGLLHPNRNNDKIEVLYKDSRSKTKSTGTRWVVDHIIPMGRGGWHHEHNLQVMPECINLTKACDPLWECCPFKSWRDVPEYLWPNGLVEAYRELKHKNVINFKIEPITEENVQIS